MSQLTEKLTLLEQTATDAQQEAQMYKSQAESMKEEQRKLEGEHKTLKRAMDNGKKLLDEVEREKNRIHNELKKIAGTNVNQYQSAFAEAEIHRKKAMNQISTVGQSTMNQIYAQNNKTKGVQTNIKDVNSVLEVIKKNIVQKIQGQHQGTKDMVVQTDDSMVILTQADYKKLLHGRHTRGLS